jgi:hypothetical protein
MFDKQIGGMIQSNLKFNNVGGCVTDLQDVVSRIVFRVILISKAVPDTTRVRSFYYPYGKNK